MIASLVGLLVAAVALAVVLSRPGEAEAVRAESVSYRPPNSFTPSTATPGDRTVERLPAQQHHKYAGSAPDLYGGSGDRAVCDVERQIAYLGSDRAKAEAFASVVRTSPKDLPGYLRGLMPVQLRLDTLVTNHGYEDGEAVPYQAVLQTGTAVLVDGYGTPRVRCACGNPLDRPRTERPEKVVGRTWPGFRAEEVAVVVPAPTPVPTFTVVDVRTGERVERPAPGRPSPSATPTGSTPPATTEPPAPTTPTGTPTDTPAGTPTDRYTDGPTDGGTTPGDTSGGTTPGYSPGGTSSGTPPTNGSPTGSDTGPATGPGTGPDTGPATGSGTGPAAGPGTEPVADQGAAKPPRPAR